MAVHLRRGSPSDAPALGDICYRAFKSLAEAHGFEPDFPSVELAVGVMSGLLAHPGFYNVVAEAGGRIVGSNFLDERNAISGVGPITIDPDSQNDGAGRALMVDVMTRSEARGFAGIRLVQAGYHSRSLALYAKLGFAAREPLACLQGPAIGETMPSCAVRPATPADLAACDRLCLEVHGHARSGELADAIAQGSARVVERSGRTTGYASMIAFFGHAVGETNDDLKALIAAAEAFLGPGFLIPTRNHALLRWTLEAGLRITQTLTLNDDRSLQRARRGLAAVSDLLSSDRGAVMRSYGKLWPAVCSTFVAIAGASSAVAAPSPAVIADIDLAKPFATRAPWRFTATQGEPIKDPIYGEGDAPGPIKLCLRASLTAPCDAQLRGNLPTQSLSEIFSDVHFLSGAEVVRPHGVSGQPLLLVQTASLRSGDGDRVVYTQVLAYRRADDRFERIYERSTGRNNNQETRFIAAGPLRGDIISVEPTENAPYGFWISVSALTPQDTYRQVLRYRSATRYNDGNSLAVIDSEMPNIQQRLGVWKPGTPLPLPPSPCPKPHLIRAELWCR